MNHWERSGGQAGLDDPAFEHDACGVGFVADRAGRASPRTRPAAAADGALAAAAP